jgi:hypothetical protein
MAAFANKGDLGRAFRTFVFSPTLEWALPPMSCFLCLHARLDHAGFADDVRTIGLRPARDFGRCGWRCDGSCRPQRRRIGSGCGPAATTATYGARLRADA